MFFVMLYRWFQGYVFFKAPVAFPERFLNLCAANNITIWRSKIKNHTLYGRMLCKDYKHIRHYAHVSGILPKIYSKHGFKCELSRYSGRYGIIAGLVLFIVVVNLLSMFTWNININGNSKLCDDEILSQLQEIGIYEGVLTKSIEPENARQQLLINTPALSWCAINLDGCFATIEVRETNERQPEQKTSYPANIVAKTDGVVKSIRAYYGVPTIKVGEAVAQGDMLVSGTMESKTGCIVYCEARAEVIARTTHTLSAYVPFKQRRFDNISVAQTRNIVEFLGVKIPLFLGEVSEPFSVNRWEHIPTINNKRLPMKIYTAEFCEQQPVDYTIDEAEAKKRAEKQINEQCKKTLSGIMKSKGQISYFTDKTGVKMSVEFICEEDIAKAKKILIN